MGVSQMTLLVSYLGGWLIPIIAKDSGVGNAFGVGAVSCTFSFIMAMMLICLDNRAKGHDQELI